MNAVPDPEVEVESLPDGAGGREQFIGGESERGHGWGFLQCRYETVAWYSLLTIFSKLNLINDE